MSQYTSVIPSRGNQYSAVPIAEKQDIHTTASAEIDLNDAKATEWPPTTVKSSHTHAWQTGFWRRFPWLGISCLFGAVCFTFASLAVLIASDDQAVSQWSKKIAPNVILSVLNSATSICFAIGLIQGITISWWRKAMRGATIEELHHTWSFGFSLISFFKGYRFFNLCAVAALLAKLTFIDAVLFQRATTTYIGLGPQRPFNLTWYPTNSLPYTAILNDYANDTRILTNAFDYDVYNWLNSPYEQIYWTWGYTNCEGICYLDVPAPGYMVACTNITKTIDPIGDAAATQNTSTSQQLTQTTLFSVDFNITWASKAKPYPWIGMNTTSFIRTDLNRSNPNARCPGQLVTQMCELRPAMLSYPVYVQFTNISTKTQHDSVSQVNVYLGSFDDVIGTYSGMDYFDYDLGQIPDFDFLNWTATNITSVPKPGEYSVNAGIMTVLKNQYKSQTYITTSSNNSDDWSLSTEGQLAGQAQDDYIEANGFEGTNWTCPYSYDDPISTIISGLNSLSFIAADDWENRQSWLDLYDSPSYDPNTTYYEYMKNASSWITSNQYRNEVHYETNYKYMGIALALTFVCVLGILPTYWGFWQIGRRVTMNPIEVANAFQAPVLTNGDYGSGHANDVVQATGNQKVRYQEVSDGRGGTRYVFVAQ